MMLNRQHEGCLRACNEAAAASLQCAMACIAEPNTASMSRCIALSLEAAEVCRLAAASIARNGAHLSAICALCAAVCQSCADECAKHAVSHCQDSAAACSRCADICRGMA
jgi:hypothetical protein